MPILSILSLLAAIVSSDATPPTLIPHYYQSPAAKMKPLSLSADICIYGGTASGVIAAVEA